MQMFGKPFPDTCSEFGDGRVCRMTLLLGPPGSGKSTLLLALAGKLDASLKVNVIKGRNPVLCFPLPALKLPRE